MKAKIAAFAIGSNTLISNSNTQAALATNIEFFDAVAQLIYAQIFGVATQPKFRLKVFIIAIIIFDD